MGGPQVTIVSAFEFNTGPWGGPIALAEPELHGTFVDHTKTSFAKVVYGVATKVDNNSVEVKPLSGSGASTSLPFDFLVAATGFKMPTILPSPGESFEERSAHISAVYQAATSGKDVVVAGGGLIGVELAGNFCEAITKAKSKGKVTLVTSGPVLLPGYPERVQAKAKAVLEQLGATIAFGAKVSSHTGTTLATDGAPFDVTLSNGTTVNGVGCYVPSFAGRAETEWLEGAPGVVLDPKAGHRVVVDAHLCGASNPSPQVFAIGGCASIKEPWLGVPKMEAQAKTVAANLALTVAGKTLKAHREGEPGMTLPAVVQVGRHTWIALVPEVMGAPGKMLLCCGPPCNLLCPCYAFAACCGPCGGCGNATWACGAPCGYPEGKATADCFSPFLESGILPKFSLGWSGTGKPKVGGAPAMHDMTRE